MEGLHVFLFFQIPGKKGFKFHAQPQTGAYSCYHYTLESCSILEGKGPGDLASITSNIFK